MNKQLDYLKEEENIQEVEMIDVTEEYMMLYGVNVNLRRAIPKIDDGLKPVIRRIMYIMYDKFRNKPKAKVSVAIGQVETIHPHGDLGLGAIFAKLAQTFSNNIPLLSTVDTGNSGNVVAGDDFAASRYLDVVLTDFAKDVLFAEFDGKANMVPSYDESTKEPFVLPAKFPLVMINGTSGIGYTLSTDIPPFNLSEVADATIKLLKKPDSKINLVPDSPTGCDIIRTSPTSFAMQSSFELDNMNYIITFHNTPYMKYLDDIDKKLREVQLSSNPIKEILSANDESELIEGRLKYVIRCSPCNLYNVINKLFKRVPGFVASLNTRNMLVVDEFMTKHYDARQILLAWIRTRLKCKRDWLLRELVSKSTHANMIEGKIFMLSPENLQNTIKVIRESSSRSAIVSSLVEFYKGAVTSSQANFISTVPLYMANNEEYKKSIVEYDKINKEIEEIREIVEDPEKIRETIIQEIRDIKGKYGTPRKSRILNVGTSETSSVGIVQILVDGSIVFGETENPEHLSSDVTPIDGDVLLVDDKGLFLWINPDKIPSGHPMTMTSIGNTNNGKCMFAGSNKNANLIILTNKGRIKCMPISSIGSSKKSLIPLDDNETIVSIIDSVDDTMDLLIYTTDGLGKRISISSLNKMTTYDSMGQFILKDYETAGMFILNPNKPMLCYVTNLGKIRVNASKYLNTVKKFAEPSQIIKLSAMDSLLNVACVDKDNSIVLHHADSRVSSVTISSLPVSTMSQEPTRPKHVPSGKIVRVCISR